MIKTAKPTKRQILLKIQLYILFIYIILICSPDQMHFMELHNPKAA